MKLLSHDICLFENIDHNFLKRFEDLLKDVLPSDNADNHFKDARQYNNEIRQYINDHIQPHLFDYFLDLNRDYLKLYNNEFYWEENIWWNPGHKITPEMEKRWEKMNWRGKNFLEQYNQMSEIILAHVGCSMRSSQPWAGNNVRWDGRTGSGFKYIFGLSNHNEWEGSIEFPIQRVRHKLLKGQCLVFPTGITHPHCMLQNNGGIHKFLEVY
jgi:hypothetical protein